MIQEYSKYKLYRKYKTEDGVNYTPLDEYQAVHNNLYYQCDCGYREYEWRISDPIEYACGSELGDDYVSTTKYEKWYKWGYCPDSDGYDEITSEYEWRQNKVNHCDCGYYEIEYIPYDTQYLSYNEVDDECVYIYKYEGSYQSSSSDYMHNISGDFTNDLSLNVVHKRGNNRIYFTSKNNMVVIYINNNFPSDYTKKLYLDDVSIIPQKGFNYYELSGDTTTEHTINYSYIRTGTDSHFDMYIKGVNDKYMFYPVVESQVCEGNVVGTNNTYYVTHDYTVETELITEPTPNRIVGTHPNEKDELITYAELMEKYETETYPYVGFIVPPNYYKTMSVGYSYCCGSNAEGTKFTSYPSYNYNGVGQTMTETGGSFVLEQSENFTYLNYSDIGYCIAPWRIHSIELVEGAEDLMINGVWRYYYNVTNDGTKLFTKKEFVEYE